VELHQGRILIRLLGLAPALLVWQPSVAATDPTDSTRIESLSDYFKKAHWEFHSRTFFMATVNEGHLKDDFALAQGTGLGMLTHPIKGFQVGVTGYFIFNVWSSDIWNPDPTTGAPNRYESGQFDIRNLRNKTDMDRLEALYLKYSHRGHSVTLGRMDLRTPFMNPQDGRMRPTLEEGIWLASNPKAKLAFNGGWITRVSPRSTLDWATVGESVGIYPPGLDTTGKRSQYPGHIHSRGFAMANAVIKPTDNLTIELWEGFFENVLNTAMAEVRYDFPLKAKGDKIYLGSMGIWQHTLNNGGNPEPAKSYALPGAEARLFSVRTGLKRKRWNTNINYTRITDHGRYLMPREWGRDPFYTFLNRERNEGFGDVHAFMIGTTGTFVNNKLRNTLAYGYYNLPDVTDFRLNKYAMPSYHQVNFLASYFFDGFWKGMEMRTLIASKIRAEGQPDDPKYTYNKVNMINFNLMFDFRL
jgi:hypothetical protein